VKVTHRNLNGSFRTVTEGEGAEPTNPLRHYDMTLLLLVIPIMIAAVAIAAVPLLVLSAREHKLHRIEAQRQTRDLDWE
jgi:hypothetical protein